MRIFLSLSAIALRQVLGTGVDPLISGVESRLVDASNRWMEALRLANDRAWRALELALAGQSWWQKCRSRLTPAEERAFAEQVQLFLETIPEVPWENQIAFRQDCLQQLREARKQKVIPGDETISGKELAEKKSHLGRFQDPQGLLQAEMHLLIEVGDSLSQQGYPTLGQFVSLQPSQGTPLLMVAVKYFFRRHIEDDPRLRAGIEFEQLESLGYRQAAGFSGLHQAFSQYQQQIETQLDDVLDMLRVTHEVVLDIHQTTKIIDHKQDRLLELMGEMLHRMKENPQVATEVATGGLQAPSPSLASSSKSVSLQPPLTPEEEDNLIVQARETVMQVRSLPDDGPSKSPELLEVVRELERELETFTLRRIRRKVYPAPFLMKGSTQPQPQQDDNVESISPVELPASEESPPAELFPEHPTEEKPRKRLFENIPSGRKKPQKPKE